MSNRNKDLLRLLLAFVVGGGVALGILHLLHPAERSMDRMMHMIVVPGALVVTYQALRWLPFFKVKAIDRG